MLNEFGYQSDEVWRTSSMNTMHVDEFCSNVQRERDSAQVEIEVKTIGRAARDKFIATAALGHGSHQVASDEGTILDHDIR